MASRSQDIPNEMEAQRSLLGPWFAAWAVMALVGACYLVVVSVRPAFLEGYLPVADTAAAETANQTAADLVGVKDSLGQLRSDMDKAQADIAAQGDRERSLADRVAALEQGVAPTANATAPSAEPAAEAGEPLVPAAETAREPAPGPAASTRSSGQPRVLNAPDLETGSVEAAPAPPAAAAIAAKPKVEKSAAAKPAGKPVGIRLATGSTVDNLRVSWSILTERHGEELKPLKPRYHTGANGNGIVYDLVAGPFKSTAEAKKVCKTLQEQAIACQVSEYSGNAL